MTVSKAFRKLVEALASACRLDSPVLIVGDVGTGKRQSALSLHNSSHRKQKRFVAINCIGLSEERFELELCGSQSQTFELNRKGALFLAEEGSLYLHEIGELSFKSQSLLFRCIESGFYCPVGSNDALPSNVRFMASSSGNLKAAIESGRFRTDLYHLLSSVIIPTPALNDRIEDMPRLLSMMINEIAPSASIDVASSAIDRLMNHSYSGNLVELKNIVYRAIAELTRESGSETSVKRLDGEIIRRVISSAGLVDAADASNGTYLDSPDYMNSKALVSEATRSDGKEILSYRLNRGGRWDEDAPAELDMTSDAIVGLDNIDKPLAISEFNVIDSDRPALSTREKARKSDSADEVSENDGETTVKKSAFMSLKDQEKSYLTELLRKCDGDKRSAARIAGVTLRTFYRKLEGLDN